MVVTAVHSGTAVIHALAVQEPLYKGRQGRARQAER